MKLVIRVYAEIGVWCHGSRGGGLQDILRQYSIKIKVFNIPKTCLVLPILAEASNRAQGKASCLLACCEHKEPGTKKVDFTLDVFSLISAMLATWLAVCFLLEGRRGADPSAGRFGAGTVAIVWSAEAIDTDRWSCSELYEHSYISNT